MRHAFEKFSVEPICGAIITPIHAISGLSNSRAPEGNGELTMAIAETIQNPGRTKRAWLRDTDCRLEDFVASISRTTRPADYPHALRVEHNVPVYDGRDVTALSLSERSELQAELAQG